MDNLTISFMFPVLNGVMGGVQNLIINLASYFSERGSNIKIYDYKNGMVASILFDRNIEFTLVELDSCSNISAHVKKGEFFIGFNSDLYNFPSILPRGTQFLIVDVFFPFWSYLLKPKGLLIPFFTTYVRRKLVEYLIQNHGLMFIDNNGLKACEDITQCLISKELVSYLPVERINENYFNVKEICLENKVKFGCLGRAVHWKATPIMKLVKDLSLIQDHLFEVHIITDNEKYFKGKLQYGENVEIVYVTPKYKEELDEYIIKNVDIGYAMGTSALEFGKLGCPTIVADLSVNEFPDNYKYKWLCDITDGQLGNDLSNPKYFNMDGIGLHLEEIISSLLENNKSMSKKTYQYVRKNHHISVFVKTLEGLIVKNSTDTKAPVLIPLRIFKFFQELYQIYVLGFKKYERR